MNNISVQMKIMSITISVNEILLETIHTDETLRVVKKEVNGGNIDYYAAFTSQKSKLISMQRVI